jgi:protein SCO1/2
MKKTLLLFISITAFHCGVPDRTYPVKGTIHEIDIAEKTITIGHDTIPNLMMPMVMPFTVQHVSQLAGLAIGDSVHFDFLWADTFPYARDFKIVGKGKLPDDDENDFFEDKEYSERKISEIIDDVTLLNIDSSEVKLLDSDGNFRFISFIFTRCPMPNMCPAIVMKNNYLVQSFKNRHDIDFIMVSFDYIHDTPSVLKDFYGSITAEHDNWYVWSSAGKVSDVYRLTKQVGCEFWGVEENNIGHNLRSVLLGPDRKILGIWPGTDWLAGDVENSIQVLMQ